MKRLFLNQMRLPIPQIHSVSRPSVRKKTEAFTLLELLVVILITAVLAAFLFPTINKTLKSGQQAACMANLRQLATGWQLYCNDNDGDSFRYDWGNLPNMRLPYWAGQIQPYLGNGDDAKIFLCPTAPKPTATGGVGTSVNAWSEPHAGQVFASSYGLSAYWYSNLDEVFPGDPDLKDVIGNIRRAPFVTPVFADSAWVDNMWAAPVPGDFVTGLRWVIARHQKKGINIAFSDGSVRFVTIGEYYRDIRMHKNDVVPHLDRYNQVPPQYR